MPLPTDMKLLVVIAAVAIGGATAYLLVNGDRNSPPAPTVVSLPSVTAPPAAPTPASKSPGGSDAIQVPRTTLPPGQVRIDPPPDSVRGPAFPVAAVRPGHRVALHI